MCGIKKDKSYGKSVSQTIDKRACTNLLHLNFSYCCYMVLF